MNTELERRLKNAFIIHWDYVRKIKEPEAAADWVISHIKRDE